MSEGERVCPHCGTDRYKSERIDRLAAQRDRYQRDAERLAREKGLLTYQLELAEARARDFHATLQRKIVRQARAIRRLEKKVLGRGEQPHAGVRPDEVAPVSDIPDIYVPDAGQRFRVK